MLLDQEYATDRGRNASPEDIWRTASRLATDAGVLAPTRRSSKHSITF